MGRWMQQMDSEPIKHLEFAGLDDWWDVGAKEGGVQGDFWVSDYGL
jgi:hypothetical protein